MLTLKLLNPAATLNNYLYVNSVLFVPGSALRVIVQITQNEYNPSIRKMLVDPAAIVTLKFDKKDNTVLSLPLTPFANDRSIWEATLTPAQTTDLTGGNLVFSIDQDGTGASLELGYLDSAFQRVNTGGC